MRNPLDPLLIPRSQVRSLPGPSQLAALEFLGRRQCRRADRPPLPVGLFERDLNCAQPEHRLCFGGRDLRLEGQSDCLVTDVRRLKTEVCDVSAVADGRDKFLARRNADGLRRVDLEGATEVLVEYV